MFKKMIFLFSVLVLVLSLSVCDSLSPTEPEDPEDTVFRYRTNVKVVYKRDPNKILNPYTDLPVTISYRLYYPPGSCRKPEYGAIGMEEVAKNVFVSYARYVFIQRGVYQEKHKLSIQDHKLYDGLSGSSIVMGNVESIEGAYDITRGMHVCSFRMSVPNSSSSTLFIQE